MIQTILWLILIDEIVFIILWWASRRIGTPKLHYLQKEVDLRLTYKRYLELYPTPNLTYEGYKKMQAARAYKKAVSSTKIKRMVR